MSADNFFMVREYQGRWYATMHFASDTLEPVSIGEYLARNRFFGGYEPPTFATKEEAIAYAADDDAEYGVVVTEEDLQRVRDEKAADRQAMMDLVAEYRAKERNR